MAGKIPQAFPSSSPRPRIRGGSPLWAALLGAGLAALPGCQVANGGEGAEGGAPARAVAADQAAGGDSGAQDAAARLVPIRVAGIEVRVEIADEPGERERGLMYRDSLPEDEGMLFVYPQEQPLSFWMKNTPLPLDIAFIDQSGRIVDIQQMEPFNERTHVSRAPAMYALEMRLGWFADHEVEVGDTVEF